MDDEPLALTAGCKFGLDSIQPATAIVQVAPCLQPGVFLQDCDPEIQREATDKTARQSLAVLEQPVHSAAWQHVPSTYLLCAEDQGACSRW